MPRPKKSLGWFVHSNQTNASLNINLFSPGRWMGSPWHQTRHLLVIILDLKDVRFVLSVNALPKLGTVSKKGDDLSAGGFARNREKKQYQVVFLRPPKTSRSEGLVSFWRAIRRCPKVIFDNSSSTCGKQTHEPHAYSPSLICVHNHIGLKFAELWVY